MDNKNQQGSERYTLIVMQNKDVYYLDDKAHSDLAESISGDDGWFQFIDARSGKQIKLQLSQVSSIVRGTR